MGKIYKNGVIYGGGGEGGSVTFEELTYAEYQSGNYDKTKSYHIPDFPYTDGIASQISFDDSVAQTGTKNVQGAIEKNSADIAELQTVESETVTLESMLSSNSDIVIQKVNRVVELSLAVSITADVASWSKIASIPSEFAPPQNRYFQASTGERAGIQVIITHAGNIMLGASLTSGSSLFFDVSYIV